MGLHKVLLLQNKASLRNGLDDFLPSQLHTGLPRHPTVVILQRPQVDPKAPVFEAFPDHVNVVEHEVAGVQKEAGDHHVEVPDSLRVNFEEVAGHHSEVARAAFDHGLHVHVRELDSPEDVFEPLLVVKVVDVGVDGPGRLDAVQHELADGQHEVVEVVAFGRKAPWLCLPGEDFEGEPAQARPWNQDLDVFLVDF